MSWRHESYEWERLQKIIPRAKAITEAAQRGDSFSPFPATEALDLAWALAAMAQRCEGCAPPEEATIWNAAIDAAVEVLDNMSESQYEEVGPRYYVTALKRQSEPQQQRTSEEK